jgi:hypothetical protein
MHFTHDVDFVRLHFGDLDGDRRVVLIEAMEPLGDVVADFVDRAAIGRHVADQGERDEPVRAHRHELTQLFVLPHVDLDHVGGADLVARSALGRPVVSRRGAARGEPEGERHRHQSEREAQRRSAQRRDRRRQSVARTEREAERGTEQTAECFARQDHAVFPTTGASGPGPRRIAQSGPIARGQRESPRHSAGSGCTAADPSVASEPPPPADLTLCDDSRLLRHPRRRATHPRGGSKRFARRDRDRAAARAHAEPRETANPTHAVCPSPPFRAALQKSRGGAAVDGSVV